VYLLFFFTVVGTLLTVTPTVERFAVDLFELLLSQTEYILTGQV